MNLQTWLENNLHSPSMEGLEVIIAGLSIPRRLWRETIVHNESDIELVINS